MVAPAIIIAKVKVRITQLPPDQPRNAPSGISLLTSSEHVGCAPVSQTVPFVRRSAQRSADAECQADCSRPASLRTYSVELVSIATRPKAPSTRWPRTSAPSSCGPRSRRSSGAAPRAWRSPFSCCSRPCSAISPIARSGRGEAQGAHHRTARAQKPGQELAGQARRGDQGLKPAGGGLDRRANGSRSPRPEPLEKSRVFSWTNEGALSGSGRPALCVTSSRF